QIQGQILGRGWLIGMVSLNSAQRSLTTPVNDIGEFSLPLVDAGNYTLLIQLEAREILIEDLELGY
ncbi:hypothetical protein HC891_08120, partial [Candidatus Gracilibacteria bacterium]|nr:hypothetical protein [Candidatus Gracilibacteria bacterium]